MKIFRLAMSAGCVAMGMAAAASPYLARAADQPAVGTPGVACTLLLGGGGPDTGIPKNNQFWFAVTSAVSAAAYDSLVKHNYTLDRHIVDDASVSQWVSSSHPNDERFKGVNPRFYYLISNLQKDGCQKVLQISYVLKPSGDKPGIAAVFGFDVSVIWPDAGKPTDQREMTYRVSGNYHKEYIYPLTKESFDRLRPDDIGAQIAADVDAAKVLPAAK